MYYVQGAKFITFDYLHEFDHSEHLLKWNFFTSGVDMSSSS
jgi:hypothetical protein